MNNNDLAARGISDSLSFDYLFSLRCQAEAAAAAAAAATLKPQRWSSHSTHRWTLGWAGARSSAVGRRLFGRGELLSRREAEIMAGWLAANPPA